MWAKLHQISINGMVSLKSSTECTKNLDHGEIYIYCGPYTDKSLMAEICSEIITHLNYSHPSGEIYFGRDVSRQKIDILYKLKIPKEPKKMIQEDVYTPIKSLNSFMKDWCLKARVTLKSALRVTAKGKSMMKIELLDQDGSQIEAAFFGTAADMFDKRITQGKVYKFSNGSVKACN